MTKNSSKPRVMVCFGTRPEVVKIASTIHMLIRKKIPFQTVFTGQHDELYQDVAHLIPEPDFHLSIMEDNQSPSEVVNRVAREFIPLLKSETPDLVIVQGDTSTAATVALISFYEKIPVGHIEAGLRTYNPQSPFPEEINRQIISRVATLHWAPTQRAVECLKKEGIKNAILTGNTVIDVCQQYDFNVSYSNKILITLHRRENFGERMAVMFTQIENLAKKHPELEFIFPMHPNPEVQRHCHLLQNVHVVAPLKYEELLKLLSEVKFIITDSGGIQEECAVFRKKVIVCRDVTERPEGVEVGLSKLVGIRIEENFDWANENPRWEGKNPYGDGKAAERIVESILNNF